MLPSRSQKLTLAVFASLTIALTSAGAASATDRHASPAGGGADCSQPAPCSITTAINSATAGDVVIIGAGTYGSLAAPVIDVRANTYYLTIRGESPFARPKIYASNTAANSAAFDPGQYSSVSDLDIVSVGSPNTYYGMRSLLGSVNRVSVSGTALEAICAFTTHANNSSCSTTTPDVAAISSVTGGSPSGSPAPYGYDLVNVTAVSPDGTGLILVANTGIDFELLVSNSILRGSVDDIYVYSDGVNGADADIVAHHSNFSDVTTGGVGTSVTSSATANNQSTVPQFVSVADGNLRQLDTSPTINAGDDASVIEGPYDAGGAARIFGAHVDIGAYEWSPASPIVIPPVPTELSSLKALTKKFASAKSGAAFREASKRPKAKKGKPPIGTLINFTLSQADTVNFTLEKGTVGRKSGGKCVKKTRANVAKKKCTRYVAMKGTESVVGAAGKNTVWFTGRWRNKALPAGSSFVMRGTPIKASTGNEPGVLNPRPIKTFPK